jgi:glycosyltransferase involved in cell wall biosynthesis
MMLGMPVVALAATGAPDAVPPEAGVVSADVQRLRSAARRYLNEPAYAHAIGAAGRRHALTRFGVDRFIADWNQLLSEVTA